MAAAADHLSLRWVGERLAMGHYPRVTQAVNRMNRQPAGKPRQMRETLRKLEIRNPSPKL